MLIGAPILIALITAGSPYIDGLGWVAIIVMSLEFAGAVGANSRINTALHVVLFMAVFAATVYAIGRGYTLLVGFVATAAITADALIHKRNWRRTALYPLLAALTISFPMGLIVVMRGMPHGAALVLVLFITNWATDIGALLVGRRFGKRLLAPRISPQKSLEGAGGGWLIGFIFGTITGIISGLSLTVVLIASAAIPVLTISGDLLESAVKRALDVKDMGYLLPGHGGFLDRLDGLLLASPVYFAIVITYEMMLFGHMG